MKRFWMEEADEFFEEWPEVGYNKFTLLDVKVRRKHVPQRYLMNGEPDPETPCIIERLELKDEWKVVQVCDHEGI